MIQNHSVRKVYYIDETETQAEGPKETIEMPTTYDYIVEDVGFTEQLAMTLMETPTYSVTIEQESQKLKNK